jgi:hypothetical protein
MRRGAPIRIAAINIAVFAGLTVLILGGLETWLRLTIPSSSKESIYEYTLDTPRYKRMKADAVIIAWGKELRTNNLGFRDNASTIPAKQKGEYRIVVLGDSFTVSAGVGYADLYTTQMERQLRQRFPHVKVINLAVGGYNIVQYELVLKEVALGLNPDMVLVSLFPSNDFSNETYDENYRVASGQAAAVRALPWHETTLLHRAYGGRLERGIMRLFRGPALNDSAKARSEWDQNAAALQSIVATARERNLAVQLAMLPATRYFESERALFARVEKICRDLELACLNLLEPFIAARISERTLWLNALDAHPNERYNAFVAAQMSTHLSLVLGPSAAPAGASAQ